MKKEIINHHSFLFFINIIVLIIGCYAFFNLKVQLLPTLPNSTIYISILNPGVQQDIIEKNLTSKFEDFLSTVNGLESMISASVSGESKITLNISQDVAISEAVNQVRDLILKNKWILPEGAKEPIVSTENSAEEPMIYLTISSEEANYIAEKYIENLKKKISFVKGVSKAVFFGLKEKSVNIYIDP